MRGRISALEFEFRRRGAAPARELCAVLGISQPLFSLLVAEMGERLVRLRQGRSVRYALRREIPGLGSTWPIYEINAVGKASSVGWLHALEAGQWFVDTEWETLRGEDFPDGLYPGLPWFMDDLRPQGFLGRAFARTQGPLLGLSPKPEDWQATDVLMALLRRGEDLQGSFVFGESMLADVQQRMLVESKAVPWETRADVYPQMAVLALAGEWPGSSAAGEQPKFTVQLRSHDGEIGHFIVKFSGCMDQPEHRRWADLLVAEHIAATVLAENGIPASRTEILEAGDRVFLEARRFDREGAHGRRGLVSMRVLDEAFFGETYTPWTQAAARLRSEGWVTEEDAARLVQWWWFGTLIGNNDMHYGNVSLHLTPERPLRLAPAYDMLPMLYRPNVHGGLPTQAIEPPTPTPEILPHWKTAISLAGIFWERVGAAKAVSPEFREIARVNAGVVEKHRRQFS